MHVQSVVIWSVHLPGGMQFLRTGEHSLVSDHSEQCVWSVNASMLQVSETLHQRLSTQDICEVKYKDCDTWMNI